MKLNDKGVTEEMRDLALNLLLCECRGWPAEDFKNLARQMDALIPDWQNSIKWARRRLAAGGEANVVEEEAKPDPFEGAEILCIAGEEEEEPDGPMMPVDELNRMEAAV
jgi:hypothetical protein